MQVAAGKGLPGEPRQGIPRLAWIFMSLALLAGIGIVSASAIFTLQSDGTLDHWLLGTTLTVERLLPLIGIGLLLGQMAGEGQYKKAGTALLLLLAGLLAGFAFEADLLRLLAPLPAAAAHLFLVGPIACLLAGLVLVLPVSYRYWPALVVLPLAGATLALAVRLSDPSLHDSRYFPLALVLVAVVLLAAAALAGAVTARWTGQAPGNGFAIASRVFGSWLLAIGALYGGAYMASGQTELTPPAFLQPPVAEGAFPGFAGVLPDLDAEAGQ